MKVSIVGTGYVGLVTGACLAECGHEVICVDVDPRKVEMINSAHAPIHESGLPELLQRNSGRRLRASTDLAAAVAATELTFIAVGTPASGGKIDLQIRRGCSGRDRCRASAQGRLPYRDRQKHGDTRHDRRCRAKGAGKRIREDRRAGIWTGHESRISHRGYRCRGFLAPRPVGARGHRRPNARRPARAVFQLRRGRATHRRPIRRPRR